MVFGQSSSVQTWPEPGHKMLVDQLLIWTRESRIRNLVHGYLFYISFRIGFTLLQYFRILISTFQSMPTWALYTVEKFVKSHAHFLKCGTFSCLFRNLVVKLSAQTQCKCTGALTLPPIRWACIYLFNYVAKNAHFCQQVGFWCF